MRENMGELKKYLFQGYTGYSDTFDQEDISTAFIHFLAAS
jgi:hypothetical protein